MILLNSYSFSSFFYILPSFAFLWVGNTNPYSFNVKTSKWLFKFFDQKNWGFDLHE